jgi:hypothetical protein
MCSVGVVCHALWAKRSQLPMTNCVNVAAKAVAWIDGSRVPLVMACRSDCFCHLTILAIADEEEPQRQPLK